MEFAFHVYNRYSADGIAISMERLLDAYTLRRAAAKKHVKKQGEGSALPTLPTLPTSAPASSNAQSNASTSATNSASLSTPSASPIAKAAIKSTSSRAAAAFDVQPPVVVCVGSDLAIGDSLGPIVGSMLKYKTQGVHAFIYGTLAAPITAKEIKYLRAFLKETHPFSPIIAVDAAVGAEGDIGLVKLSDTPLYPGAGANKKLGAIGDISMLGIVAEKSVANYGLLNTTRLNLVYSMAELISDALATILYERKKSLDNTAKSMV